MQWRPTFRRGDRGGHGIGSRARSVAVVAATLLVTGCGGGNDGPGVSGVAAGFTGSGTAAQGNMVRLAEGASSGNTLTVEVVCGETDRADIYGFAFDLVLDDPAVAEYVTGSVRPGNALGGSVLATAEQRGSRIVVGVTQTDQTGDKIARPEAIVVRLGLRALKAGTTEIRFEGSTGSNPTNDPTAVDESGSPIGTIAFDAVPATVIGR